MKSQPHTPAPRAPRLSEMTLEQQLAHCQKTLKKCLASDHHIAASFLRTRIRQLKQIAAGRDAIAKARAEFGHEIDKVLQ